MVQLCSIDEVRGRTTSSIEDDALADIITSVSEDIERYVGTWLAPRSDITLLFDMERVGARLYVPQGVRAVTGIGTATSSQPESGGTYNTVSLSNILLRPRVTADAPATSIVLSSGYFSRGFNTVTVTGSFGPASIAARVRETAIELVLLTLNYNPLVATETVGDWTQVYAENSAMNFTLERDAILSTLPAPIAI